jgi:hypothetical protein
VKPRTLLIKAAAAYVGVCENTFRTHVLKEVTVVKVGRRRPVLLSSLDTWLERHGRKPEGGDAPSGERAVDWLEKMRTAHHGSRKPRKD